MKYILNNYKSNCKEFSVIENRLMIITTKKELLIDLKFVSKASFDHYRNIPKIILKSIGGVSVVYEII